MQRSLSFYPMLKYLEKHKNPEIRMGRSIGLRSLKEIGREKPLDNATVVIKHRLRLIKRLQSNEKSILFATLKEFRVRKPKKIEVKVVEKAKKIEFSMEALKGWMNSIDKPRRPTVAPKILKKHRKKHQTVI